MKFMSAMSLFLLLQAFVLGTGVSHAETSSIPVEIQPTSYVTVAEARAMQEGTLLKVSGTLTRPGEVHLPGHVDLVVFTEDGAMLEKRRISVPGLNSNRRGRIDLRFVASFDLSLPAGSRAVLRYHVPGAPQEDC